MIDVVTIWTVIVVLGVGTFLIRFSFLGLIGSKHRTADTMRATWVRSLVWLDD